MSADNIIKIAVASIGLLVALVGPATWFFRELVKYLLARIAVLEGRETTLLAGAVEAIKEIGAELDAQGELVRTISKQEERRQWDREREARP
jgi:hypothetical protein